MTAAATSSAAAAAATALAAAPGNDLSSAIFAHLLATQMAQLPPPDFFELNAAEIKPTMHRFLADWMLEVCEAYSCAREVYPTAVVLLDRYAAVQRVTKQTYQLLGATCLHVASKLLGHAVPMHCLCDDMDNFYAPAAMKELELALLSALGWHVETAKPLELLEHFLRRLSIEPGADLTATLRANSEVFVYLVYTDVSHARFGPAIIAAAALFVAACGIDGPQGTVPACNPGPAHRATFLGLLQYFPDNGEQRLRECVTVIEQLYAASLPAPSA